MKDLIETGLVGAGRLRVSTPALVGRYNEALSRIGVEPTALTSFSIDGIGWSPEIAGEKKNPLYLFQGEANRCAIILSPDQEGKPIYFPYASYERALMRAYFGKNRSQIVDITTTHPIVLILDQEITRYETPLDLLLNSVNVKTDTEGLVEAGAAQQAALAALTQGDGWMSEELRLRLAQSAKEHGDLRFRDLDISDFRFTGCRNFFTEAFGGVFVLRGDNKETLLVLEQPKLAGFTSDKPQPNVRVIARADPSLPALLTEYGFATVDLAWYGEHPLELDDIRDCLIATLATEANPDLTTLVGLSDAKRKNILAKIPKERTSLLGALERLRRGLAQRHAGEASGTMNAEGELALLLMRPTSPEGLGNPRRDPRYDTVSMLLARLRSFDPLELYRADKNRFVEKFRKWPVAFQEWAAARIKARYEPVMNQPNEKD